MRAVQRERLARPGRRRAACRRCRPCASALGLEVAEAGVGRRDEKAVARQPHADVAGAGVHVAALEERAADAADSSRSASARSCSQRPAQASAKKSAPPKLPDFSASAQRPRRSALASTARRGRSAGADAQASTPSACTTAPEVSPPATTSRRTPRSTRPRATAPAHVSTSAPARAAPSAACTAFTAPRRRGGVDQHRPRARRRGVAQASAARRDGLARAPARADRSRKRRAARPHASARPARCVACEQLTREHGRAAGHRSEARRRASGLSQPRLRDRRRAGRAPGRSRR